MLKQILRKLLCFVGSHEWTCAAQEGQKPSKKQLRWGVAGFMDYAKMYCKYCKRISRFSL